MDQQTARIAGFTRAWLAVLLGAFQLAIGSGLGPDDGPPRPPSRIIPATGLGFYGEYDGLGSHADAWKATAAADILLGTSAGSTISAAERQLLETITKLIPNNKLSPASMLAVQDHLIHHGFSLGYFASDPGEESSVWVIPDIKGQAIQGRFEESLRSLFQVDRFSTSHDRGRDLFSTNGQAGPPAFPLPGFKFENHATWWFEGNSLVIVNGPNFGMGEAVRQYGAPKNYATLHQARLAAVLDTIEGKQSAVSTLPIYATARAQGRDLAGFEPNGLFFAVKASGQGVLHNLGQALGPSPGGPATGLNDIDLIEMTGLGRAERIHGRWGFRGKSLLTDIQFESDSPWKGTVGFLDRRGFPKGKLPPLPRDIGTFAIGSLGRMRDLEVLESFGNNLDPQPRATFSVALQAIREATTPAIREELAAHLGPTWSAFATPPDGKGPFETALPGLLVAVDDPEAASKALDTLSTQINEYFGKLQGQVEGDHQAIVIERLPAPDRGFRLASPGGVLPWLRPDRQPTLLLGQTSMALASSMSQARSLIDLETRPEQGWKPSGELVRSLDSLPSRLTFMSVGDPRDSSWPEAIARLPETLERGFRRFINIPQVEEPPSRPADLFDLLGVPDTVARRKRTSAPKAEDLRSKIHPSVLAAVVEERTFRVIRLEALPLGCLWFDTRPEPGKPENAISIKMKFGPGR